MAGRVEELLTTYEELELWRLLRDQQDEYARQRLITYHSPLAHRIAAQLFAKRFDDSVEFGDYLQCAVIGLIEAVDRYDPVREASFATFAHYRIKGAILNGLEKATEKHGQIAFRQRLRKERLDSLTEERASEGLFVEMVDIAVGLAISYMLEDTGMIAPQEETRISDEPYNNEVFAQLRKQILDIVNMLPEREQMIIRYHYYYQIGFDDLSRVLNITKGRISQLHKRALQRIREALEQQSGLDTQY